MNTISIIAAMDEHRLIGANKQLPWHIPSDLQHFKKITLGKPIIMGRHTFESIGKPLPNRSNIVITRDLYFQSDGILVAHTLNQALELAKDGEEIMIIGGTMIFEQAIALAHRMYLTIIHHTFQGDTYFPQWNTNEWKIISQTEQAVTPQNPYALSFLLLERRENIN